MGDDGPAAFQDTVAQIDGDAPPEGDRDVPLRRAARRRRRPARRAARGARREARGGRAASSRCPASLTSDAEEAQRVLDEALAAGHEGVVVKDAASPYAAGRRGKAWRKVKPVRTYDLVVLGAEWGHGRRQGWLSNLHLGARDAAHRRVRDGRQDLQGPDRRAARVADEGAARRARPSVAGIAVLVRPELVVEIALDGVQASTRYPGGVALRFARVKRYRPDKDADEADTIDDLRALLPARR